MTVRRHRPLALVGLLVLTFGPQCAGAQTPVPPASPPGLLQIDEIFAEEPMLGRTPRSLVWAPDGSRFLYTLAGNATQPSDTHVYDVRRHSDTLFFRIKPEGKGARPAPEFVWSPDSRRLAYLDRGSLWTIGAGRSGKRKLADGADDPQWSPDSRRIAYVHAGDLYAVPAAGGAAVRFSHDGSETAVNGDSDWAYSEELELRHAYRWSPDGTRIAYLRFDQRPVTAFPIVDFLATDNVAQPQRYPLAGERNSVVTLRVATPGTSRTLYSNAATDEYLARVGWTPAGEPALTILDRAQRHLRYVAFGGRTPRTLLREDDAAWVDLAGEVTWLADRNHFLFLSDRDGRRSLYLGNAATGGATRLTTGFRVNEIAAVDEQAGVAYVDAAYPTRADETTLRVPLRGGPPLPLANGPGSHRFTMAPNGRDYVRIDASFAVPPTFAVGSTRGGEPEIFAASRSLAGRTLGTYEFRRLDTRYGKLDAWMIKPPNFDPSKRYPAIMYVYGGPAAPTTTDAWDGEFFLYHQALAQRGYIVFSIDGPGSQIDSTAAVRRLYHRLGPASLEGQLEGVDYLRGLPFVDPKRIGLWGWSFGGYETAYALTHAPTRWKAGIAVAPVTDWRYHDTIYTERYMGKPQDQPAAYSQSSVLEKAANLQASLLIAHGTADDNVHLANTVSLVQALVLAGKPVDLALYPRKGHGIEGVAQLRHLFTRMLNYWQEKL